MKNLTLNKINFAGAEVLSREQMKKVMGGGSPGNGSYTGDLEWCNGMTASECTFIRQSEASAEMHTEQEHQTNLRAIEELCNYLCSETRPI
jgi:hypothetical protein